MATLFVEQLTVIDSSLLHKKRGLVGETWIVDIELDGQLDKQGMVLDFGKLKPLIKELINTHVDHKLLVPTQLVTINTHENHHIDLKLRLPDSSEILYTGPSHSVALIPGHEISADSVARYLKAIITDAMPKNVSDVTLHLRTEKIQGAFFQYSHGLRKHDGNCQRIAHGHRSRLHIDIGGKEQHELEAEWANRWKDIYLADRADLVGKLDIHQSLHLKFEYSTCQGKFSLVLPARKCYLFDTETTIENIAQHIATQGLSGNEKTASTRVRVYEGFQKGAIGIA